MDPLKVLILYGGEAATKPRNELLNWLNSSQTHAEIGRKVDARKVAEMTAHMEGSIDQRVEDMMNWADKAIFLLTTDTRSKYGAPNVLEEFGRWIGQKERKTMMALRQEGVEVHSNASGLVYVAFKDDVVGECRKRLVAFINDPVSAQTETAAAPPQAAVNSGPSINIGGGVNAGGDFIIGDKTTHNTHDHSQVHTTGRDINHGPVTYNIYNSPTVSSDPAHSDGDGTHTLGHSGANQSKTITITELRKFLSTYYGKGEIRGICQEMKIDDEDFGTSKADLILDLLPFLKRRSKLNQFLQKLADDPDERLKIEFGTNSVVMED